MKDDDDVINYHLKQLDEFHDNGDINNFEYIQSGISLAIFGALVEIRDLLKKDKK